MQKGSDIASQVPTSTCSIAMTYFLPLQCPGLAWKCLRACVRMRVSGSVCNCTQECERERGREKRWMDLKFSHIYSCRAGEPCSAHHRPRPPPAQRRRRRLGTGQHREPNIKRKKIWLWSNFFLSFKDVSKEIRSRGDEKNFLQRIFWTNWDLSRSQDLDKKSKFMTKTRLEWKWLRCVFIITL